jgi:hypothetical protein
MSDLIGWRRTVPIGRGQQRDQFRDKIPGAGAARFHLQRSRCLGPEALQGGKIINMDPGGEFLLVDRIVFRVPQKRLQPSAQGEGVMTELQVQNV